MKSLYVKAEAVLATTLLAVIVLLVFTAGITRWFGYPLVWSVDVAQLLFAWASFLGADLALRKHAHIGIDYLVKRLPARPRAVLDIVLALVVLAFLLTMTVKGYQLTMLNLERQFGDSGISYAFVTAAVPAGCLLLSVTLLGQTLAAISRLRSTPRPIFTAPAAEEVMP
ncbi:TRAP transporter small permease [Azospirillum sp. HJ39]|uniref:TRAP transporter small permease n=1 Tax=Azospirillum sp. HJ39 TaxID=3159496 RepID=UPI003556CCCC